MSDVSQEEKESIDGAIFYAKKYVEDLLSFFGLNTDVYATTEDGEVIEINIPSTHMNGFLIGAHGDTARALQFTVSTALRNQGYTHNRINIDVADYKRNRAERLAKAAQEWFEEVKKSGQEKHLQPMNAADRRVVHQAATDYGLSTESQGEGRDRHIVLRSELKAESSKTTVQQAQVKQDEEEPESETKAKNPKPKTKETKAKTTKETN